jgi:predicted acyltransferase (DUF342 family)
MCLVSSRGRLGQILAVARQREKHLSLVIEKSKGNVCAKGKTEIKKDGSVIGDLTTAQIIIEDGAYFKGSIEIDRGADKQADKNVSPGTTSRPTTSAAGAGPKSI